MGESAQYLTVEAGQKLYEAYHHLVLRQKDVEHQIKDFPILLERFEKALDRFDKIQRESVDKVHDLSNKINDVRVIAEANKMEIDRLWKFPMKVAGAITVLGGALTMVYYGAKYLLVKIGIIPPS